MQWQIIFLGLRKQTCVEGILTIRDKVDPNSVIHTDGWRGYDGLVDWGFGEALSGQSRQQRIRQGVQTRQRHQVFLELCQASASEFHGVRRDKFALHLKEIAFCFNHRHLDLCKALLKLIRNEPL